MMRNKPVIGILPTYNLVNEENDPYQDRASFVRMYVEKIRECGGIPIGLLDENMEQYYSICDAYVWPGGSKIWKNFYLIFEDVLKNHKPLLGICLGAQAIATYFNVLEDKEGSKKNFNEVYQEMKETRPYLTRLKDEILKNHNHYVTKDEETIMNAKHEIFIEPDSFLFEIYGTTALNVVSLHGIQINRIPKNILASAKSLDGILEAVEYHEDDNIILGVQFHPEILADSKIFEWFLQKTKESILKRNLK